MPRLLYLAPVRFPTEKAHGLQIAQNCEALADAGYDVQLWTARRANQPALRAIKDIHAHYGVAPNFRIVRLPVLDLYPLAGGNLRLERIAFYINLLCYMLGALARLPFAQADVIYSRDDYVLAILSRLLPREELVYEAHLFAQTARGKRLQSAVVQTVGSVVAITPRLAEDLVAERGAKSDAMLVAHDGVRRARFAELPAQGDAREQLGWSKTQCVVGFVGRLQMLNMDKGVGTLVEALGQLEQVALALVGGPDDMAEMLRARWLAQGLSEDDFLYAGQVPPERVPVYVRAFDICAMPHPFTTQFAYYTSPLKLFEYMAAERAIVASDLPGWADVLQHERNALLVPAGDTDALAAAIARLRDDAALRRQLGEQARRDVLAHYTWDARAQRIRAHIERQSLNAVATD